MKFHSYLETLLGSRVMIRLLQTLVNQKGRVFTVRRLAQAAGVSASEAGVAVQQLERYGVLRVQPAGRSYVLSLNNDSYVLDKILQPAIKAERDTLPTLVRLLQKHLSGKPIVSAALFGSLASGDEREDSDIDLFIVSDDFDGSIAKMIDAQDLVSSTFNKHLSPLVMGKKKFISKKDEPLVRSIMANHIMVAGKDLSELVR
ncbi:MAG: nucleotidyltransferase domain-containing protein [Nitrososphaera sp.]